MTTTSFSASPDKVVVGRGRLRDLAEVRIDQEALPAGFNLRLAEKEDIPALVKISDWAAGQAKQEGLFLRMSKAFLADFVRDGIVLLPVSGSEILGYSNAMQANDEYPPFCSGWYRHMPGLLFGTVLGPNARGQGWHDRLIHVRMDIFRDAGLYAVQSTASPYNHASLDNLLAAGFQVLGLRDLLDGHPRFQLNHNFMQNVMSGKIRKLALPRSGSLKDHEALLAEGYVGVGLEKGDPSTMCYMKASG